MTLDDLLVVIQNGAQHWRALNPPGPPEGLRSSAAPEDGRCLLAAQFDDRLKQVAILGRPGGRPLPVDPCGLCGVAYLVAILGRPGGRPLHTSDAFQSQMMRLRSSAAPEDGRCRVPGGVRQPGVVAILGRPGGRPLPLPGGKGTQHCMLRSSAAPEDGRCADAWRAGPVPADSVAILGRPGGRPLLD